MICQSTQPGDCLADLSIVLVDAVSSVSTGQLNWQNDRTGRVSWQPADLRVTGQSDLELDGEPNCSWMSGLNGSFWSGGAGLGCDNLNEILLTSVGGGRLSESWFF